MLILGRLAMNYFRLFQITCLFLFAFTEIRATNPPPPLNHTVYDDKGLGMLGIPGPCPTWIIEGADSTSGKTFIFITIGLMWLGKSKIMTT